MVSSPLFTLVRRSKCKLFHNFSASLKLDILEIIKKHVASSKKSIPLEDQFTHISVNEKEEFNNDPLTLDLDPSASIQFAFMGQMAGQGYAVPTLDEMLNSDTRSAVYPAREGSFSINRLNTVAPAWKTPTNGRQTANGLFTCYIADYSVDGLFHFYPLYTRAELGAVSTQALDTQWTNDMTWQWIQYQGLSYNSNQDVVTQQQLLATKYVLGYEFQPAFQSPFAGLQKLSPQPDLMGMEKLMREFYEFKSVLPAKFNFLGMLARGAQKLLPMITKNLPGIMKAISGVSDFADEETRSDARMRHNAVKPHVTKDVKKVSKAKKEVQLAIKDVQKGKPKQAKKLLVKAEKDVNSEKKRPRKRRTRKNTKKSTNLDELD